MTTGAASIFLLENLVCILHSEFLLFFLRFGFETLNVFQFLGVYRQSYIDLSLGQTIATCVPRQEVDELILLCK